VLKRREADRIDAFYIRTFSMNEASRGASEQGGLSPAANGAALKDLTLLLGKEGVVDEAVRNELFRAVYAELRAIAARKMASERPGHTLQATALVHEAWIRLGCGETSGGEAFENRAHFFSAAAEAMRRILVEAARRKGRDKRGAGAEHVDVDAIEIAAPAVAGDELLRLHEVLDAFAAADAQKAELVKLRFFVGLSLEEAGAVLGLSERTAKRHWAYARAWLFDAIQRDQNPGEN
jgi:RNA polymerase sigma factor (TIGR02999 family)